MTNDEPGVVKSTIDGRDQPVDGLRGQPEEIKITRLPLNVATEDQRRSAGEREAFRLREARDDHGHLLLERAQHLRGEPTALDPPRPRPPNGGWENQLVPELEQAIGVDVEAHVLLRSLPQHLLVNARAVTGLIEVVRKSRAAPANVERKLDPPASLGEGPVVQVVGHGHGSRRGAKIRCPRLRHRNQCTTADSWRAHYTGRRVRNPHGSAGQV